MLGLIRRVKEHFDLNRYPHEYPKNMVGFKESPVYKPQHLNKYFDVSKGYFTLYDLAVYIIVGVFMLAFYYIVVGEIEEKEKGYMFICVSFIGISILLY